ITRRPSEKFGEEVVMLTEDDDTDAVLSVCRRVLPRYSQPKACRHVARLPVTATGKPARGEAAKIWKQP
ncbi:MAG: O-succinylbenzoic acid--CoA ligase, partial [Prevotella sp.]|nr:O-succinylbenzoic acid--CoA ligase [Prevotella sp.]